MKKSEIIRAWTDPEYRASLSPEQLEELPAHPAGPTFADLEEEELREIVAGGDGLISTVTAECVDNVFEAALCGAWSYLACRA